MELSLPYVLVGPDGTRAVIGNSDEAKADPDWCGFVDPEAGIVGLDGADVRESADNLVEQDGGVHGPFYEGRRAVVLNVIVDPANVGNVRQNQLERKLKRATRALRADTVLTWTPSDIGLELRLLLRRQGKVTIAGRRPHTMQIPMVSADAAVRSSSEAQAEVVPDAGGGIVGYTSPYASPYGTTAPVAGQTFLVNQGDLDAIPRFRIDGPITNPEILNNSTGQRIKLLYTLAAGEWLDVDVGRKTVLLNGMASRFGAVVYPDTKWWRLRSGSNDVRLLAAAYSAGAKLTTYWRHPFE